MSSDLMSWTISQFFKRKNIDYIIVHYSNKKWFKIIGHEITESLYEVSSIYVKQCLLIYIVKVYNKQRRFINLILFVCFKR